MTPSSRCSTLTRCVPIVALTLNCFCIGPLGCTRSVTHRQTIRLHYEFLDQQALAKRAEERLAQAIFWKPKVPSPISLDLAQAPLFMEEKFDHTDDRNDRSEMFLIPLRNFDHGTTNPPTVFVWPAEGLEMLNDGALSRRIFAWYQSAPKGEVDHVKPQLRGVRITYNREGLPILWEASHGPDRPLLVFVSAELERTAVEQFGPPLAGRLFAVEKPIDETPQWTVVGAVSDAATAMGPVVHIRQPSGEMSSIICRCMPSLTDEVVETRTYQLAPWPQTVEPARKRRFSNNNPRNDNNTASLTHELGFPTAPPTSFLRRPAEY